MNLQEAILEAYKEGLVDSDFVVEKLKIMGDDDDWSNNKTFNEFVNTLSADFKKGKFPKDTVKVFIKIDNLKSGDPKITTKLTHADKKMDLTIDPYYKEKDILNRFKSKVSNTGAADAVQITFKFVNYPDPEGISVTYGPYVDV